MADGLSSRSIFLQRASDHLVVSSPAVSAHLRSVHQEVAARDNGKDLRGEGQACRACGNLLVSGWSCTSIAEPSKKARKRKSSGPRSDVKVFNKQCSKCNTITKVVSQKPPRNMMRRNQTLRTDAPLLKTACQDKSDKIATLPARSATAAPTVGNRKTRNKQPSLQAMLALQQSKARLSTTTALDISDFIKK
jgi:hypothetical protein